MSNVEKKKVMNNKKRKRSTVSPKPLAEGGVHDRAVPKKQIFVVGHIDHLSSCHDNGLDDILLSSHSTLMAAKLWVMNEWLDEVSDKNAIIDELNTKSFALAKALIQYLSIKNPSLERLKQCLVVDAHGTSLGTIGSQIDEAYDFLREACNDSLYPYEISCLYLD